jgi:hypothetical protein
MFWNRGRKRWVPDRDADQANLAGDGDGDGDTKPPPKPKPKPKPKTPKADDDSVASDQSDRALLADAVDNFGHSMRGIASLLEKVKNKL